MEQEVDAWLEQLRQCKQLTEAEVQKLCDKECSLAHKQTCILISHSDEGSLDGRVERPASTVSGDCMRGCAWPICERSLNPAAQYLTFQF
jgi:hypothetical protein